MDINTRSDFHSSLIPVHWTMSDEILEMLISVYERNQTESWYAELLTYMIILISDSTDSKSNSRRSHRNVRITTMPTFINMKIFNIVEKIYKNTISMIRDNMELDDQIWSDYEDMLIFEIQTLQTSR